MNYSTIPFPTRFILIIFFLLSGFPSRILAQEESNNWYFGLFAAISFSTDPPTVLSTSQMATSEGCASISDEDGALLFYTDGLTVFNANHQEMLNGAGLLGGGSSSQSAIIVQAPENSNLYYVFTVMEMGMGGLSYSVVDMNLDGGLGAVVSASKNTPLVSTTSEKVTAVRHANGIDIWIITSSNMTNEYYSFLLTPSGMDLNTVESTAGSTPDEWGIGYLKGSFDGSLLVSAHCLEPGDNLDILSFNNATGAVSDLLTFSLDPMTPYGIEFSPDQSKLYISTIDEFQTFGQLVQFDISNLDATAVQASKVILDETEAGLGFVGAIQLASDGRIYVSTVNGFLGAIENPNEAGVACGYNNEFLNISPGTSTFGLPNFFPNFSVPVVLNATQFCFGVPTQFTVTGAQEEAIVQWNFGDINSANNAAEGLNVQHLYSQGGTFTVTATVSVGDEVEVYEIVVVIDKPELEIDVLPGLSGLAPFEATFDFNASGLNLSADFQADDVMDYTDTPDFENTTYIYTTPGIYLATAIVEQNGCIVRDSIFIEVYTEPWLFIPNVITPNGDGKNNLFFVKASGIKDFELSIYNRYGILLAQLDDVDDVFEPIDPFDGWRPDEPGTNGVYYYHYKGLGFEGQELDGSGTITVLGGE